MEKTTRTLYGFTGDSFIPQGTIKLPNTAGEKYRHATVMVNFVVIKKASQYNVVIGRMTLRALKVVTSTYHQKIKFLTPNGIGEIKCSQYELKVAYSDAVHNYDDPMRLKMRMASQGLIEEDIDPRVEKEIIGSQPIELLEEILVDKEEPTKG